MERLLSAQGAQEAFNRHLSGYGESGPYQEAQVLAQGGAAERVFAMLERAFDGRDPGILPGANDPLMNPLRGEPATDRLLLRLSS